MLCCNRCVFRANNQQEEKRKKDDGNKQFISGILEDWKSIFLLFLLYALQGLPLGVMRTIPLIIQAKKGTYKDQAKFAMAGWPFSFKLLWAPLVDTLYFKRMGRRKSWVIPCQYAIAAMMLFMSFQVDQLLDSMDIGILTILFFCLTFLIATQDVGVDGWSLTFLNRKHVGLASTCGAVGSSFGYFIGHVVFLNLSSPDFSNKYLRSVSNSERGVVTLSDFLLGTAIIYFICTTAIFIFKKEEPVPNSEGAEVVQKDSNSIISSYIRLWHILQLPAVQTCVMFFFTCNIAFAAEDALGSLKFVEAGLSREVLAQMSVPLTPISFFVPIIISKWTAGVKPMRIYMTAYFFGLLATGVIAVMVWVTKHLNDATGGNFPTWYVPCLIGIQAVVEIIHTIMGVARMSFITKISDPAHGSTFMTLYYTIGNLGGAIPSDVALWLVDSLTVKSCTGESCLTMFDGYYVETIACMVIGFLWFIWGNAAIKKLQEEPEYSWRIATTKDVDAANEGA